MNWITSYCGQVWSVLCELAPWFLFGAIVAGLMHGLAPSGFVKKRFSGFTGVLWSVLFGIPLPLCSCAVIPTGIGLRRNGASEGASVGFLIATPQTGIDSVFVTAAFLGWTFAFYKLFVALVLGVAAGWLIEILGNSRNADNLTQEKPTSSTKSAKSCCSLQEEVVETITLQSSGERSAVQMPTLQKQDLSVVLLDEPVVVCLGGLRTSKEVEPKKTCCQSEVPEVSAKKSCCSDSKNQGMAEAKAAKSKYSWVVYLTSSFASSLSIVRSIYVWVLIGVLISAALSTLVPADLITQFAGQNYALQLLVALLVGIPLYVCATASVPIAAALVSRGLSVGAAAVFLIAGPATNVATIGAVRSQFSRLAFWTYMGVAILGSLGFAIVFDKVFPNAIAVSQSHQHQHNHWFNQLCAGVLVLLFAYFSIPRWLPKSDSANHHQSQSCS